MPVYEGVCIKVEYTAEYMTESSPLLTNVFHDESLLRIEFEMNNSMYE